MSLRKLKPTTWVIACLVALIVAAALSLILPQLRPQAMLHVGDGIFKARIARTAEQRETGLSGVATLNDDQAMLFVFDRDSRWSIWMKDMNFPIDIVWLDAGQKVVHIVKNASPGTYPQEVFTPKVDARYVVELKAGMVDRKSVAIGQSVTFDINQVLGGKR